MFNYMMDFAIHDYAKLFASPLCLGYTLVYVATYVGSHRVFDKAQVEWAVVIPFCICILYFCVPAAIELRDDRIHGTNFNSTTFLQIYILQQTFEIIRCSTIDFIIPCGPKTGSQILVKFIIFFVSKGFSHANARFLMLTPIF